MRNGTRSKTLYFYIIDSWRLENYLIQRQPSCKKKRKVIVKKDVKSKVVVKKWLIVIKDFAIPLPSQPFFGHHFGFHIFFHNCLLGGYTLFYSWAVLGLDFTFFCLLQSWHSRILNSIRYRYDNGVNIEINQLCGCINCTGGWYL